MVSAETLLPKQTILVSISVNLLANVDILDELGETSSTVSPSIHAVSPLVVDDGKTKMCAFCCPIVTSSNLPFLSSVMFLLKISILLLDDNRLFSQYSVFNNEMFHNFLIYERVYICNFISIFQVNFIIIF